MSEDTSDPSTPHTGDIPPPRTRTNSLPLSGKADEIRQSKRKTEIQKLTQDTSDIDVNVLNTGGRLLRSQKTLLHQDDEDEQHLRQEFEKGRIIDEEISFRPRRAGQTTSERHIPTRHDFEYIYHHIDDSECQTWASELEPWLQFIRSHNLRADPSIPILDKEGNEYPDVTFSLDNLLQLPTNKKYLKKKQKQKHDSSRDRTQATSSHQHSVSTTNDPSSSSGSSSSFVILSGPTPSELNPLNFSDLDIPPSVGGTPNSTPSANTPTGSPPRTPSPIPTDSDSDSDPDMASLKERAIFFPTEKFDGKNKALTKQHWQRFEDFCNQQKMPIVAVGATAAATIDQVKSYFQMTLTDLARVWIERTNFTSAEDLKKKFLSDFSPYGKTHREWITKWGDLKFNPDMDNIDEFIEKFEDLAKLNNFPEGHKLEAFKITMPREIELHLKNIDNIDDCYKTAKDLLPIIQNPMTNKMSTLSLAQSRSPSPQPRKRSPSPRNNRPQNYDRSRPRDRNNGENFAPYPSPQRPQPILKRPYTNPSPRGRGRGRSNFRSRSMNRPRWINKRCFNCNMIGHLARNCFTRTRPQSNSRANFPRHFTPNGRRGRGRGNSRYQQPRVRFQDQNNNWPNGNGYPAANHNPQGPRNPYNPNSNPTYNPNYNPNYNPTYNPYSNQPPANYNEQYPPNYHNPQPESYNPQPQLDQTEYDHTPDPYGRYQDLN